MLYFPTILIVNIQKTVHSIFSDQAVPLEDIGHQKNDANDARAICEEASRSSIHSVPTKTVELQDIKSIRSIRQRRFEQRLAAANQLQSLASEYGVVIAKSFKCLREQVPVALEDHDHELSLIMRRMLHDLLLKVIVVLFQNQFTQYKVNYPPGGSRLTESALPRNKDKR